MSSLYDRTANLVGWLYDRRLDGPPVLDAARRFPAADAFAAHWHALRAEALALAAGSDEIPRFHELMASQAAISANDQKDWRMFVLKAYGVWATKNLSRCPVLAKLVASEPAVLSATLSFLAPGKHIPRHRGPMRGVIRYYLGLSVPPGEDGRHGAVLILDDREYVIGEGQWLLWDDTYPHEGEVVRRTGGRARGSWWEQRDAS